MVSVIWRNTSEHCFVILIPLYCKLTVISWLNDCEDMKLVVPTQKWDTISHLSLTMGVDWLVKC